MNNFHESVLPWKTGKVSLMEFALQVCMLLWSVGVMYFIKGLKDITADTFITGFNYFSKAKSK